MMDMQPKISEFQQTLERAVGRILHIHRKLSPYSSSRSIQELEVVRSNASTLRMIFKDLGPQAIFENARVKPEFLYEPIREIETYRTILHPLDLGTAECFAAVSETDRYWLFLEYVDGIPLWQSGDLEIWRGAARWLAQLHSRPLPQSRGRYLLRYDLTYYEQCWQHAVANDPSLSAIESAYERATTRLLKQPLSLIHGEFYASNVLVDGNRVCPIDWETTALGPGLIDLAALTAGKWDENARMDFMMAYTGGTELRADIYTLECCRLHLAVRLLAWARPWQPPVMHAHNWRCEALQIAKGLA
jgi:hypothetical protein